MISEFEKGFLAYEQGKGFSALMSEEWQSGWWASFKFWME